MAYAPPSIGPTGLTIPSYNDILAYYLANFASLYGATVDLEPANSDYQLLALFALSASDNMQLAQAVFNNQSPNFAVGAGLSSLVKINGLARKVATASTCQVTLTGDPDAVVTNGIVQDINGNLWNLPLSVTITSGSVDVVATAQQVGAINITAPNQITTIVTPTAGWATVNNNAFLAVVGRPVETDAQLRARQAVSAELPSVSPVAGTQAAVLAVPGVTRANVVDNPTGSTDAFGNPPHSVTAVVEGGAAADIALAIYLKKTIGCLSNGTTSETVTDPVTGNTEVISFDYVTATPIFLIINAHIINGGGTLSAAQVATIQAAVAAYLNGLQIGGVVSFGELVQAAALAVNANQETPVISIRNPFLFARTATPAVSTDIQLAFNEAAAGIADNTHIQVNSV